MRNKIIILSVFVLAGCMSGPEESNNLQPASYSKEDIYEADIDQKQYDSQEQMLKNRWGIKVESTILSAGDYMIDFRFRVLDVEKAKPILDRSINPYLIDQASEAVFAVPNPPKVGQLRSGGNIKDGNVCFIYFANPAKYIKMGNKVTVQIGDFSVKDLVVQ